MIEYPKCLCVRWLSSQIFCSAENLSNLLSSDFLTTPNDECLKVAQVRAFILLIIHMWTCSNIQTRFYIECVNAVKIWVTSRSNLEVNSGACPHIKLTSFDEMVYMIDFRVFLFEKNNSLISDKTYKSDDKLMLASTLLFRKNEKKNNIFLVHFFFSFFYNEKIYYNLIDCKPLSCLNIKASAKYPSLKFSIYHFIIVFFCIVFNNLKR